MVVPYLKSNLMSGCKTHHSPLTIHERLAKHHFPSPNYFAKRYFPSPLGERGFDKVEVGRGGETVRLRRTDEVFSPFTIYHSQLTIHYSPLTIHHSPLTTHHSSLIIHHSSLTIHHSLLPIA
jgi:hypothetical protein